MHEIPIWLKNPLSANSEAFIIYFCGLRSHIYKYIRIKSFTVGSKPVSLKESSCLLRLGSSSESSFLICGSEVTERYIHIENNDSIAGLLCEYTSDIPTTRRTIELRLTSDASDDSNKKSITFDCPTNIYKEEGAETINVDTEGGELDVYYLSIRPTVHLEQQDDSIDEGNKKKKNESSASGFRLKPVGSTEGSLLCVGHRGMGKEEADHPADKQWPENTMLSFWKAAQLGVPMIELDVIPMRESDDMVIYHNFNIVTKIKEGCKIKQCGCPLYEIDLFSDSGICNKSMLNLIPTFSPNEIKDLKWGQHSRSCEKATREHKEPQIQSTDQEIFLHRDSEQAEYLPFFSDVLNKVPLSLSLDIELKYPPDTPYSAFRLMHEFNLPNEKLADYGHPSRYFYSINQFADHVIRALNANGRGRTVIVSTFNPDLCLALRLKQTTYPVLFISRAGIETALPSKITALPPPPHSLDPRHRNAATAIEWAHLIGVDGVVIRGQPFLDEKEGAELACKLKEYGLACISYGPCVSTPEFKIRAEELGITGICVDDVEHNRC
nr:cyclin dependent kinase (Pho85) [Hymenolepis microstoma]